jgi:hypothetical protein
MASKGALVCVCSGALTHAMCRWPAVVGCCCDRCVRVHGIVCLGVTQPTAIGGLCCLIVLCYVVSMGSAAPRSKPRDKDRDEAAMEWAIKKLEGKVR